MRTLPLFLAALLLALRPARTLVGREREETNNRKIKRNKQNHHELIVAAKSRGAPPKIARSIGLIGG